MFLYVFKKNADSDVKYTNPLTRHELSDRLVLYWSTAEIARGNAACRVRLLLSCE